MTKLTVKELLNLKGKTQLTEVFVSSAEEARACAEAGIDMLVAVGNVGAAAIREAAPDTFLTLGVSKLVASKKDAVKAGLKLLRLGADAVYTGASLPFVKAMARESIPVVGHVGLVPYRSSWFGGFKAVGKTAEEALEVYEKTIAYQEAGAIAVEIEVVPHQVATEISKRVDILVISMGSGSGCDAQYLFATDILGTNTGHVPRHAKEYEDFKTEYARLYRRSVTAFKEFKEDVAASVYPAEQHQVDMASQELEAFKRGLEQVC
ncbi:MAG: 3-methyl-2-oxobutanoate hydroxymethyltransferase [Deinococcota bacterium]